LLPVLSGEVVESQKHIAMLVETRSLSQTAQGERETESQPQRDQKGANAISTNSEIAPATGIDPDAMVLPQTNQARCHKIGSIILAVNRRR
jgi:hypothetical protein